tara:strand:- start:646 stop:1116 length:471 start_codon:yes stop_codon:yes gene_type:complete
MGSGKTTIGRKLAMHVGKDFLDLDRMIESRENRTINKIFSEAGENYFRHIERVVLKDLAKKTDTVIATGGGTFVDIDNRQLIETSGSSIWLNLSFEETLKRLTKSTHRPLAADQTRLKELFQERISAYQHADLRIDANGKTIKHLVSEITSWIQKQ